MRERTLWQSICQCFSYCFSTKTDILNPYVAATIVRGTTGQIRNRMWKMREKHKLTDLEKRLISNIKNYLWEVWEHHVSTSKYENQNWKRTEITEHLKLYTMSPTFQRLCPKTGEFILKSKKKNLMYSLHIWHQTPFWWNIWGWGRTDTLNYVSQFYI